MISNIISLIAFAVIFVISLVTTIIYSSDAKYDSLWEVICSVVILFISLIGVFTQLIDIFG